MKSIHTKTFLTGLLMVLFSGLISAQSVITVGTGTATYSAPYTTVWMDSKTEMLFTGAELLAAGAVSGRIIQIGFHLTDSSSQIMNGFTVKMQNTSNSSVTAFTSTGWTTVYSGNYAVPDTGWQMLTLNTEFSWDGSSNLLIQFCFDNSYFTSNSPATATAMTTMCWHQYQDLTTASGCDMIAGVDAAYRPNMRFVMTPPLVCGSSFSGNLTPTTSWQNASYTALSVPYWRFYGVAGQRYDFGLCSNTEDSYLRVFDTTGLVVTYNDDSGPFCNGLASSLTFQCTTTGYYYVTASHLSCGTLENAGNLEYRTQLRDCSSCAPEDVALGYLGTPVYGGSVSGNCGFGGKWSASFNGLAGRVYHFDLCPDAPGSGTADFDIDIKITDASCNILAGQDGSCTVSNLYRPNDYIWTCPSTGVYYVILAPYNSYSTHNCLGTLTSTFTLQYYVEPFTMDACPANAQLENEPECNDTYVDLFNGGCNSTPNVFSVLANNCSGTVCGKSGVYDTLTQRDTDWFTLTVADSTNIYVDCIAEFSLLLGLIDGNAGCPISTFLTSTSVPEGVLAQISYFVGPGTYWIWVGPSDWGNYPCGSDYRMHYTTVSEPPAPLALSNPACGSTTLSVLPPSAHESLMWQGNSCDSSLLYPATSPFTVTASGNYFVRAYNSGTGCWSENCASEYVSVRPLAPVPTVPTTTICAGTADTLVASGSTGDYSWWTVPTGGVPVGTDTAFITPVLTDTMTYYVSGNPNTELFDLETTMAGGNGYDGNMFDVTVTNNITIDSFYVNIDAGPTVVRVYYKTGSYVGFNTDPAPWILVDSVLVTGAGVGLETLVPIGGLALTAGQTYGLYVTNDGSVQMNYTDGALTFSDTNISIITGHGGGYPFNLTNTPRAWNGRIFYHTSLCGSDRVAVPVNVASIPAAAGVITGISPTCDGVNGIAYSVPVIANATTYSWNYSGTGATINGTGNAVTLDFAVGATSGALSVEGENLCGIGAPENMNIVVNSCAGISENDPAGAVQILPNPNPGMFSVLLEGFQSTSCQVDIYNLLGELVYNRQTEVANGHNRIDINLSQQPSGSYYLKLTDSNQTLIKPFMISK